MIENASFGGVLCLFLKPVLIKEQVSRFSPEHGVSRIDPVHLFRRVLFLWIRVGMIFLSQRTVSTLDLFIGSVWVDAKFSIGKKLLEGTLSKMSDSAVNVLKAANVDINAVITGAGEALIAKTRTGE